MTEKQPNIQQRILAIMSDLHYICKGDKTVNGQYRFVSHDQVTEAIQPLLVKHGVICVPTVASHKQDGNRTEVDLRIYYVNSDDKEDYVVVEYFGYGVDSGDKGPGKAISYAYKYAHLKLFGIATGDDPDKDANSAYEPVKCSDFDSMIPDEIDEKMLARFLTHSAEAMGKHVEEVKKEALQRMPDFLKGYNKWHKKQKAA